MLPTCEPQPKLSPTTSGSQDWPTSTSCAIRRPRIPSAQSNKPACRPAQSSSRPELMPRPLSLRPALRRPPPIKTLAPKLPRSSTRLARQRQVSQPRRGKKQKASLPRPVPATMRPQPRSSSCSNKRLPISRPAARMSPSAPRRPTLFVKAL